MSLSFLYQSCVTSLELLVRRSCDLHVAEALWSPRWHLSCTAHRKQLNYTDPPFLPATTTSYASHCSLGLDYTEREGEKKKTPTMMKNSEGNVERENEEEAEKRERKKQTGRGVRIRDNVARGFSSVVFGKDERTVGLCEVVEERCVHAQYNHLK